MVIAEENLEQVVNYMTGKVDDYFDKEMALWSLETAWNTALKNYPKEAKGFLYRITAEVLKNDE